jgi:hypothetical protein
MGKETLVLNAATCMRCGGTTRGDGASCSCRAVANADPHAASQAAAWASKDVGDVVTDHMGRLTSKAAREQDHDRASVAHEAAALRHDQLGTRAKEVGDVKTYRENKVAARLHRRAAALHSASKGKKGEAMMKENKRVRTAADHNQAWKTKANQGNGNGDGDDDGDDDDGNGDNGELNQGTCPECGGHMTDGTCDDCDYTTNAAADGVYTTEPWPPPCVLTNTYDTSLQGSPNFDGRGQGKPPGRAGRGGEEDDEDETPEPHTAAHLIDPPDEVARRLAARAGFTDTRDRGGRSVTNAIFFPAGYAEADGGVAHPPGYIDQGLGVTDIIANETREEWAKRGFRY